MKPILTALKRYEMLVAVSGIEWAISVALGPRISVLDEELRKIKSSDFEVVQAPAGYKPPKREFYDGIKKLRSLRYPDACGFAGDAA